MDIFDKTAEDFDGDTRKEHEEFTYATASEVDAFDAWLSGLNRPQQDWILSDRDVWYSNPYYDVATYGPRGPHPEDNEMPECETCSEPFIPHWSKVDCDACKSREWNNNPDPRDIAEQQYQEDLHQPIEYPPF